jgi:hypothetical protein
MADDYPDADPDTWDAFEREPANPLPLIQKWFALQCDGDWEHDFGISIETLDNPGWRVDINLDGTPLQQHAYVPVSEDGDADGRRRETRWLRCYREGDVWKGRGDPTKLNRLLLEFLQWAADVDAGWPVRRSGGQPLSMGLLPRVRCRDDLAHALLVEPLKPRVALQVLQVRPDRSVAHERLRLRGSDQPLP